MTPRNLAAGAVLVLAAGVWPILLAVSYFREHGFPHVDVYAWGVVALAVVLLVRSMKPKGNP